MYALNIYAKFIYYVRFLNITGLCNSGGNIGFVPA